MAFFSFWRPQSHVVANLAETPRPGPAITPAMYSVSFPKLRTSESPSLVSTFVASHRDADTDAFLDQCERNGRNIALLKHIRAQHSKYVDAQRMRGLSRTDAGALYLNHSMLVATPAQFRALLSQASPQTTGASAGRSSEPVPRSLLDVGAGRGEVTAALASALDVTAAQVTVVEASRPLRRQLASAGYHVSCSLDELPDGSFGVVSLLNVLDRCDTPHELLAAALRVLHPRGLLLVATPIPFCSTIHDGKVGMIDAHRPVKMPLQLSQGCASQSPFELHVAAFVRAAFAPLPLQLLAWTRVPYLCTGGAWRTYYHLEDALFVLRVAGVNDGGFISSRSGSGGRSNHSRERSSGAECTTSTTTSATRMSHAQLPQPRPAAGHAESTRVA